MVIFYIFITFYKFYATVILDKFNLPLVVKYEVDDSFDSDKFIKLQLRVMHDNKNPNMSIFDIDGMSEAQESIKNIPILARTYFDEEGKPQFNGHDIHLETDYNGQLRQVYDEVPIGVVPESTSYELKKSEDDGNYYLYASCYIWKNYSNYAQDVIERDENIKLSMEILVDDSNYDRKSKTHTINKYRYTGITLLGNDKGTGMKNAMATTSAFEGNGEAKEQNLIMLMQELKECLQEYNSTSKQDDAQNFEKGGMETLRTEEKELENKEEFEDKGIDPKVDEKPEESFEEVGDEGAEPKEPETFEDEPKEPKEKEPENQFALSYRQKAQKLSEQMPDKREEGTYTYYRLQDFDDEYAYFSESLYDAENNYSRRDVRVKYVENKEDFAVTLDVESLEEVVMQRVTIAEAHNIEQSRVMMEAQFEELKQFKENALESEKESNIQKLFSKFDEQLSKSGEYGELKQKHEGMSIEDIENRCYMLVGKLSCTFEKKDDVIKLGKEKEEVMEDPYGGLLARKYERK